jgi:hypothetical protein
MKKPYIGSGHLVEWIGPPGFLMAIDQAIFMG